MLSVNELIEYTTDIIDLDMSIEEVNKADVYDYNVYRELLDKVHKIKREILDDWYERFNGNKTLALFVLDHTYNTYTEQGGTSMVELESFIWNPKNREYKDFIYELQTKILATINWVVI